MATNTPTDLVCGSCGYSVRGVSTTICPECGADLTEVGIRPHERKGLGALNVLLRSIIYTAAMFVLALVVYLVLGRVLPQHLQAYYSIQIEPLSKEYEQIAIHINADLVVPASKPAGGSIDLQSGPGTAQTVTMYDPGTKVVIDNIDLVLTPKLVNGRYVARGTNIVIDPDTRQARWKGPKGNTIFSQAAFTDQDLLNCFAGHGADVSRADVQLEAQQLHAWIDGFAQGQPQHNVDGFFFFAYGGGGSPSVGPPWFKPAYISSCMALWLFGLVWVIRSALKRTR